VTTPQTAPLLEGTTTLMVRNLPQELLQKEFLEELDRAGFAGLYDFVYMPCSFEARESKGYVFVNFCTSTAAASFAAGWHRSRRLAPDGSMPPLNVSAATVQGLQANVQKWAGPRMTRIRNPALRPFVRRLRGEAASPSLASPSECGMPPPPLPAFSPQPSVVAVGPASPPRSSRAAQPAPGTTPTGVLKYL